MGTVSGGGGAADPRPALLSCAALRLSRASGHYQYAYNPSTCAQSSRCACCRFLPALPDAGGQEPAQLRTRSRELTDGVARYRGNAAADAGRRGAQRQRRRAGTTGRAGACSEPRAGGPGPGFLAPPDTPHLLLEGVARWLLVATPCNPPAYAHRARRAGGWARGWCQAVRTRCCSSAPAPGTLPLVAATRKCSRRCCGHGSPLPRAAISQHLELLDPSLKLLQTTS